MQASIKKIILATDFSDISKNASRHALMLAKAHKAELKALHVFDTSAWNIPPHYYLAPAGPGGFSGFVEGLEEARERGKETLNKFAKSFDLEIETIFAEGDPGHEIVRIAEELNADLIVLGTHGYSGWKRFAIGSVAELVVRHAPCAVLTIRPEGR
ncbi:MAG: universal stress protein [Nitrosomonadales bacterium]|jgi:nucleotide-binding universal stress UspA family protein|nr:MAG: universal stress protein [Nitrosomonadales bacterium]